MVKTTLSINDATFDFKDSFLFFGGEGGCILNENGISSVGNDCLKDVIIVYFVSLKFFYIG
jgi:hypothetical protein